MRYPFAALAEAMRETPARAARLLGVSGSTEQEYRQRGLTERVADRLAVRAGFHPFTVWPEMADRAIAETDAERRERLAAKERRRYQRNPRVRAHKKAAARRYHDENRDRMNALRRQRYRDNRERELEARRQRYQRRAA